MSDNNACTMLAQQLIKSGISAIEAHALAKMAHEVDAFKADADASACPAACASACPAACASACPAASASACPTTNACAGACAECDAKSYCPFAANDDFIPVPFYHGCGFDDDEDDDEDEECEVADDVY